MSTTRFEARSTYPHPASEVYSWHGRSGALERLTPPWEKVEVLSQTGGIEPGDLPPISA